MTLALITDEPNAVDSALLIASKLTPRLRACSRSIRRRSCGASARPSIMA